jgi:acetyl-CoA acetyltransferase family protein
MAETAENLAERYSISREACDGYALLSQERWAGAAASGRLEAEIVPIEVRSRKGPVSFARDEHPRPDSTAAGLAKLTAVFRAGGVVTAGNASGICDGAAALVLAGRQAAEQCGAKALARVVSWGLAGVDPRYMGLGPVPAIAVALQRANLSLSDMDLIEVNEAFAAQYLAVEKEAGLPRERTNVNGGAIALGHPLGASGARITGHLVYELRRRGARWGLGAACIGGGQGIAVIVEAE